MKYIIPRSNVGKGGFFTALDGTRYHTPSWTVVEKDTWFDDLEFEAKPFEELFTSNLTSNDGYEPRTFASTSSDKVYTVRRGSKGFYCDCWGYIGHKKCKHVKQAQEEWGI